MCQTGTEETRTSDIDIGYLSHSQRDATTRQPSIEFGSWTDFLFLRLNGFVFVIINRHVLEPKWSVLGREVFARVLTETEWIAVTVNSFMSIN